MAWSVQPHSVGQHINSWGCRADSRCNVIFREKGSTRLTFKLLQLEISTFNIFPTPEIKKPSHQTEEGVSKVSEFLLGLSSSTPVNQWVLKSRMFIPVHY